MQKILDGSQALCEVFTFKEGLLSAFGHDLRIKAASFIIIMENSPPRVKVIIESDSLAADSAVEKNIPRPGLLTEKDRRDIDRNIRKDVLESGRYEEIRFVSSKIEKGDSGYHVEGDLALHGATKSISFAALKEGGDYVSEIRLHLPDFGIKPYSAVWGSIRIKPDVLVRMKVAASELEGFI